MDILNLIDPLEAIVARLQDDAPLAGWQLIHRLHSFPSVEEMAARNAWKARAHTEPARSANAIRFQKDEDRLVVDYDYELDPGRIGRNRVAFLNMLALAYREKVFQLAGAIPGETWRGDGEAHRGVGGDARSEVGTAETWRGDGEAHPSR